MPEQVVRRKAWRMPASRCSWPLRATLPLLTPTRPTTLTSSSSIETSDLLTRDQLAQD